MKDIRNKLLKRSSVLLLLLLIVVKANGEDKFAIQNGPYLQSLKETEVTIVWQTNKPSIGWVELTLDDGSHFYFKEREKYYDSQFGSKKATQTHHVTIDGLKPGTSYEYRVFSKEFFSQIGIHTTLGETVATTVYKQKPLSFTTNDRNKVETSFVMVNDIHNRDEDLSKLLNQSKLKQKDLVIYNGDMVNHFTSEKVIYDGFLNTTVEVFAKELPMYYARGNHETRAALAPKFHDYFSCGEENLYYTFRQGPVFFVVLDGGEDKPDSDMEYGGMADYDRYRTKQSQWLASVLKSNEYQEAPFKVIICHMPPLPDNNLWHGPNDLLDKFIPLLNDANVTVMLSGHLHKYMKHQYSEKVKFPVIVNAHNTVLKAQTNSNELEIKIVDLKGKTIDSLTLKAK